MCRLATALEAKLLLSNSITVGCHLNQLAQREATRRVRSQDSTEFELSMMFARRAGWWYASGSPACGFFKRSVHLACFEFLDGTLAAGPCAAVLTIARQHMARAVHRLPLVPPRRQLTESAATVRYAVECAVRWHSDKVKNVHWLDGVHFLTVSLFSLLSPPLPALLDSVVNQL